MTVASSRKHRLLTILHRLAMIALAAWWGRYFWLHSPAIRWWQRLGAGRERGPARSTAAAMDLAVDHLERLLRVTALDLGFGLAVLLLLAIGTGVYVRRLEIWLEARTSGQAVAFGADGLEGRALAANPESRRRLP
jgi:hypothetical protein